MRSDPALPAIIYILSLLLRFVQTEQGLTCSQPSDHPTRGVPSDLLGLHKIADMSKPDSCITHHDAATTIEGAESLVSLCLQDTVEDSVSRREDACLEFANRGI